ncbi:1,4-beta-D-glucan glucohydrolase [Sorangium cellulosum]|uniref:1,4-beta-D-glucan glucohydrolase n=1 Tax=Sorangium cellulosum TaxID=56 RepID=A0A4P2QC32_SORCE|nr:glycoside hydrolase family 3 protein [Sorangium cellulosum]AUX27290.1 1,4-beta-D-glucan glucohydrolase [Sorangium cellulosum]
MRLTRYATWIMAAAVVLAPAACGDDSSNEPTSSSTGTGTGPGSGTGGSGAGGSGEGGEDGGTGGSGTGGENGGTGGSGTGGSGTGGSGTGGAGGGEDSAGLLPCDAGWPEVHSELAQDPEIEAAVAELVGRMTVQEKVGQMIQAEINEISPDEVRQYNIGSVLNGGGSWPSRSKNASAGDWVTLADAFYKASVDKTGGRAGIPIIWGIDAVHGNNNVRGATLFPHNIGLGAANDPELLERIGAATAKEVAATGLDWTFAPTLATVRDDRWGRTYEAFSEDPEIVNAYAGRIVKGIQGNPKGGSLFGPANVIATAKHFIGDGGTDKGDDQGNNLASDTELCTLHAQGYLSAIPAGVQTVMASYNSIRGTKMHGNGDLLTKVLKDKFHFDGFVIGDWNGHGQVPGCTNDSCAAAFNAGIDMMMVPTDWKAFYQNTLSQVQGGQISEARVNDAVTRILRVKMRAGLLGPRTTKGAPSERMFAGQQGALGAAEHKEIAREAVRKSLVLLKNRDGALPLSKSSNVLVAGKSANSIPNQCGGWSRTWQGTDVDNSDFPGATSIYAGIEELVKGGGGQVTLSEDGSRASGSFDAAIVVIGETPYAEMYGDIQLQDDGTAPHAKTLEHAAFRPEDAQVLRTIRAAAPDLPIVTVFLSGRPLYVNKELNLSDAFVAAWLPGTEGGGVADVLFGDEEFQGKLSFSWPASDCQTTVNRGDGQKPLFPYGFGLKTTDQDTLGDLPEESTAGGCR